MEGLICSFSPSGDALAIATADGKVRTYDTGTGRLRSSLSSGPNNKVGDGSTLSNGLLTEKHTCIGWVGGRREKSKKKQGAAVGGGVIVGTAAGDVKLYDTQLGELKWRSENVIEGGVTSVAYSSADGGVVYATGASCEIAALDLETGAVRSRFEASKHPLSCLAVSPDQRHALGGGSSLALWDLVSQERKAKYTGHPTPVRAISFAPDGSHAVSAASGERHLAVWSSAEPPAKKAKKSVAPAAATLSLEDPPVSLDTCPLGEAGEAQGSGFHVAAVSECGEAYVWACQAGADDGKVAAQLLARVRVGATPAKGTAAGKQEVIMCARLQQGTEGPSLLVARGSSAKPVFEVVPVRSSGGEQPAVIALTPSTEGALLPSSAAKAKQVVVAAEGLERPKPLSHTRNDVTVLGPDNEGQAVLVRTAAAAGTSGRKRGEPEAADELGAGAAEEEEVPDMPEDEVPLGERVAALEARAGGDEEAAGEEAGPSGMPAPQGSSKADSLAVLLTQALRSNDRALLERCLATSNPRIITNTVRRIVPMDAALFLKAAVDRVLSRPARALQLAPWIRAVLHYHTGYIMTAPGVQAPLAALYQAIDGRVSLYQQLLKVYGRLGLITSHAARGSAEEGADGAVGVPAPEVVFEDESDDDGEPAAEDAMNPDSDDEEEEEGEGEEDEDEDMDGGDGEEDDHDSEYDW